MSDKPKSLAETNSHLRDASPRELEEMIKRSVDSSTAIENEDEDN